jgi:hypothetical protein
MEIYKELTMVSPLGDQLLAHLIAIWIFVLLVVLEFCFQIACHQSVMGWFEPEVGSYMIW